MGLIFLHTMVTLFKNIKDTTAPFHVEVEDVFNRIKAGRYKDLIKSIRQEKDKTKRNLLKRDLPAICFSGEFRKRSDDDLLSHSGYICLDFDGYKTKKAMQEDKDLLMSDAYVMSVFVSPSGNGLKAVVKIPPEKDNHKRYFNALEEYFNSPYFDKTSKNISRVCYESYDPKIHVNLESDVWDRMSDIEYTSVDRSDTNVTVPITNESKIVDILLKWWTKKYPMVDGQRNNNVFILASALNEYGVSRGLTDYIVNQYANDSFPVSEIKITVDSAYRNSSAFGTKFYEDAEAVSRIKMMVSRGDSSSDIVSSMPDVSEEIAKKVVKNVENSFNKFWTKSDRGKIELVHYLFKRFLEDHGFYKYAPHNSIKYIFVKVTNNLIDISSSEQIKDFVLSHLESMDDLSIYNYFAEKTKYFKDDFLSLLDTVDIHFVHDTKDFCFIYFNNNALKVYADKIDVMDYVDLEGYVWRDQVIDRKYSPCDSKGCDFSKFISNISDNSEDRVKSLESTLGYLMSGYKDPGFSPSVILNDEVITDNPEGGTGKGLFVQGVSNMKKVSVIDGKSFSFDGEFAYQTINTDTQIISFDDVKKGFNFERLFSAITEGITIRKLYEAAIKVPFKYSPKIIITTNYAIRGKGNSFERRKWELELKQYYNKNFTPVDEFGLRFFDEWDSKEWCAFDSYMIRCLQLYLSEGLVASKFKNIVIRKLSAETCHEFIEWVGLVEGSRRTDAIVFNRKILYDNLYSDFIQSYPDFAPRSKMAISRILFYKWVDAYAENGDDFDGFKSDRSSIGKWIKFIKGDDEEQDEGESGLFEF